MLNQRKDKLHHVYTHPTFTETIMKWLLAWMVIFLPVQKSTPPNLLLHISKCPLLCSALMSICSTLPIQPCSPQDADTVSDSLHISSNASCTCPSSATALQNVLPSLCFGVSPAIKDSTYCLLPSLPPLTLLLPSFLPLFLLFPLLFLILLILLLLLLLLPAFNTAFLTPRWKPSLDPGMCISSKPPWPLWPSSVTWCLCQSVPRKLLEAGWNCELLTSVIWRTGSSSQGCFGLCTYCSPQVASTSTTNWLDDLVQTTQHYRPR